MFYRHKKTGNVYRYLCEAINCTNGKDESFVVVYTPANSLGVFYARDRSEFFTKFELVGVSQDKTLRRSKVRCDNCDSNIDFCGENWAICERCGANICQLCYEAVEDRTDTEDCICGVCLKREVKK